MNVPFMPLLVVAIVMPVFVQLVEAAVCVISANAPHQFSTLKLHGACCTVSKHAADVISQPNAHATAVQRRQLNALTGKQQSKTHDHVKPVFTHVCIVTSAHAIALH
jgi:hypothetical protein